MQAVPPVASPQVERSVQDLAQRLGISQDQITVAKVEEVEWGDTSLGCPEPGKLYAQVIIPGYRITLSAKGQTYEYHTDTGQRVVLCQPTR
ncbi:MAG: hypothetical protein HY675_28655 [Chloroflexi bacterium]|nr:hypothetical protein [Chloroflexota bacterium]